MSDSVEPTPDRIMQLISGGWAAAILGSASQHGIFNALEGGDAAAGVAKKAGVSLRGAQAVLDGLTGLGLLTLSKGRYQNTLDSSAFLVKGKPAYLGSIAEVMTHSLGEWATLPEAVKTGTPTATDMTELADNDFWPQLVPAIASLSLSCRADGRPTTRHRESRRSQLARRRWRLGRPGRRCGSARTWTQRVSNSTGRRSTKSHRSSSAILALPTGSKPSTAISIRSTSALANTTMQSTDMLPIRKHQRTISRSSASFAGLSSQAVRFSSMTSFLPTTDWAIPSP